MTSHLPFRWIPGFLGVLALFIIACQLTGDEKVENTISFTKKFDSLAQYDSVIIVLKDTSGRTIDIVYRGKVDSISEIEKLKAPHWDGGIVVVSITGYKGGETAYAVNTKFNGATDQKLDSVRVILPGTALSSNFLEIRLTEGDSIPLPAVTVIPADLSDKAISWISSAPQILYVGAEYIKARSQGDAKLTAILKSNPTKTLNLDVTVLADPTLPDSLFLSPDTLFLAAKGASRTLATRFAPITADPGVTWLLRDSTIASFLLEGLVQGLKQGETWVLAVSRKRSAILDSSLILVSGLVPVEKVQFQKDSIDVFLKGSTDSLIVAVLPPKANPMVEFEILDSTKVSLANGKILGVSEGSTKIIARSGENPFKTDTLKVTVFPSQSIDSVRVKPDSLKLFTGGGSFGLTGVVYPTTALQGIQWRSQNTGVATVDPNGNVTPESPGKTHVFADSRADSSKHDTLVVIVKKDMPQVFAGRDTVVSVGSVVAFHLQVTQEYGLVTLFRWDLNDDGVWEGSSDSLKAISYTFDKPKEYAVRFYVKDREGNDTTVIRKVKAVHGPAVQILSPLNNTYTKEFSISVSWILDGKAQDSLTVEALKVGPNTVTRSAKDEAGNLFSASVNVFVDTTRPLRPVFKGPVRSASKTPTWVWVSGGGGGSGVYKYWLDVDDSALGKEINDTAFTPATELSEALHTLFVSERDAAGNWSPAGRFSLYVDVTAPSSPKVLVTPASPTNARKPKWTWSTGGNGGAGAYQYKLDNTSLNTGATPTTDTSLTPISNLGHGTHTLYVQEKDSAGNWSVSGYASVVIDTIAPESPNLTSSVSSPTNNTQPEWNWTSGENGGRGFYRYKLGDTLWATGSGQGITTSFKSANALVEGTHTFYVEEQDSAGNWSHVSSRTVQIDLTSPKPPKVSILESPTSNPNPIWSWSTGGNGGIGVFRFKLGSADLQSGATIVHDTVFIPSTPLEGGLTYTLFVQEKDSAGNWSNSGYSSIHVQGQLGYAVGWEGTILKTTNGGSSWAPTSSGTNKLLQAVYFTDANTGWVFGLNGTIRKTLNGGATWESSNIQTSGNMNSISFPTNSVGFAAADDGTIAKTINSGISWTSSNIGGSAYLLGIHFPTLNTGYAVGIGGKIVKTINSGTSWTSVLSDSIPVTYLRSVYFTDSSTGYVSGDDGTIIKTIDGGISWSRLPTKTSAIIFSIDFPTSQIGFAVGGNSVFKTENSGETWEEKEISKHPLLSINFQNATTGYVVGHNGTIFQTKNGGATWIEQQSGTTQILYSISFP